VNRPRSIHLCWTSTNLAKEDHRRVPENMRPNLKELGLTYYETLEQVPGKVNA
jgi:hypothetical protein